MNVTDAFSAGQLVTARGREWVVLGNESGELTLRPLSGSEEEVERLLPALELDPVVAAHFPPPDGERLGPRAAAELLCDALRLSLRRGAGPFRGAGRIAFQPRAYQLAPLMMALRQAVVRLLIADDVGIGKTIEAGLILREFLDRGEVNRFTVLCPAHLVEQWVGELQEKFALTATAVTASGAARLERDLPGTQSVFEAFPFTVVSLDFIKSERRLNDFLRACPEMVVVDEAHAAVSGGRARHQRYRLLQGLAQDRDRHLVMLTATPHSGDEVAFHNLLGLLDPAFANLGDVGDENRRRLRERLAGHFIQRRRADIRAWDDQRTFPRHESSELSYRLTGQHERFFNEVLDYCAERVGAATGEQRQRLAFWGTLALMRCVGSSPAAALRALGTRAANLAASEAESEAQLAAQVLDAEEQAEDDLEPAVAEHEDPRLAALIAQAQSLADKVSSDSKYLALTAVLKKLLDKGHRPVIFCRYIATAQALGAALKKSFKQHQVEVVTGDLPAEAREARIVALGEQEHPLLVATDCLSEGINLQHSFDAVLHYDLSWNPTRHQQREGRIDRFGQASTTVRSVLLYGENNPIDGAVLEVILRKARKIEQQTGVRVPLPDQGGDLTKALMAAVLLRGRDPHQISFDFTAATTGDLATAAAEIDVRWNDASEREKRSRTIFAQRSIKPAEVAAEWNRSKASLGSFAEVERFVSRGLARLSATLQPAGRRAWQAPLHLCPDSLVERFQAEGLLSEGQKRPLTVAFDDSPPPAVQTVHRAHPLTQTLAEAFLERALEAGPDTGDDPTCLPRCGAWETSAVTSSVLLLLLRLRHRIHAQGRLGPSFALAEEAAALAIRLSTGEVLHEGEPAFALLHGESADLPESLRRRQIEKALALLAERPAILESYADRRAAVLAEDHTRVRQSLGSRAGVRVEAIRPPDVIGLYLLLPRL